MLKSRGRVADDAGEVVEYALGVNVVEHVDVGVPFSDAAAVEDGHAAGEFALGFDIDGHCLAFKQSRVGDGGQSDDLVQRESFQPQTFVVGAQREREHVFDQPADLRATGVRQAVELFESQNGVSADVEWDECLGRCRSQYRPRSFDVCEHVEFGCGRDVAAGLNRSTLTDDAFQQTQKLGSPLAGDFEVGEWAECQQRDFVRFVPHQFDHQLRRFVWVVQVGTSEFGIAQPERSIQCPAIGEREIREWGNRWQFRLAAAHAGVLGGIEQFDDCLDVARGSRSRDAASGSRDCQDIDVGVEYGKRGGDSIPDSSVRINDDFLRHGPLLSSS